MKKIACLVLTLLLFAFYLAPSATACPPLVGASVQVVQQPAFVTNQVLVPQVAVQQVAVQQQVPFVVQQPIAVPFIGFNSGFARVGFGGFNSAFVGFGGGGFQGRVVAPLRVNAFARVGPGGGVARVRIRR